MAPDPLQLVGVTVPDKIAQYLKDKPTIRGCLQTLFTMGGETKGTQGVKTPSPRHGLDIIVSAIDFMHEQQCKC